MEEIKEIQLMEEREELKQQLKEKDDQLLRVIAEFANFKRRTQEELNQSHQYATEQLLIQWILPIMDNFHYFLKGGKNTKTYEYWHEGSLMIFNQVCDWFEQEGIGLIEAIGEKFDPRYHEAVFCEDTNKYPDNTIIEEIQRGVIMCGKVIRPSKVKVARNI